MRIDKFLWSVRFYKTRNIAAEEIKKNRVSIGENVIKSSKEVKMGDVITIRGKGRFVVKEIKANTRSGRMVLEIEKYV